MGARPISTADKFRASTKRAKGVREIKTINPKISIVFEQKMFEKLAASAFQRGISFASLVREIVTQVQAR